MASGSLDARAFAAARSTNGEWTNFVLPDAATIGRVNDILIATDGGIYLACASEYPETSTAHVLRVTQTGVTSVITPFDGAVYLLAEHMDGTIYVVGGRRVGTTTTYEPVLLKRTP